MQSNVFQWDELTIIRQQAVKLFSRELSKAEKEQFCDWLEFVLCLVYGYGWQDAEEVIGAIPFREGLDDKAVNLEINGLTFRDRLMGEEHTPDEVLRLIDTESHRDYNTGVYDAAKASGLSGLRKQWLTMMDDRVRDTHSYLEGMIVGIDDRFYTYDGDSAMYPGGFALPQNNVNCRCGIGLIR